MPQGLYLAELLKGGWGGSQVALGDIVVQQGPQFPYSFTKDHSTRLLPQPSACSKELRAQNLGWSWLQTGQG